MANRILDCVSSPEDLKVLSDDELQILALEIREEIIKVTSKTGGHVASSLGAVEIILAVHSLINSPHDKFIFDVGHQAYAHKLVTGRLEESPGSRAPRKALMMFILRAMLLTPSLSRWVWLRRVSCRAATRRLLLLSATPRFRAAWHSRP